MVLAMAEPDSMVTAARIVKFMAAVLLLGGNLSKEIAQTEPVWWDDRLDRVTPLFDYSSLPPVPDSGFAVIHDEPYLTIVYDEGEFRGEIVDATLDKLERARGVAAQYNLVIDHVRCDFYTNFILHLTQREANAN